MNWPLILAATVVTIFIIALVIALGLFWPSVSKMRWDYRGASVRSHAEAPFIALVVSVFLAVPDMVRHVWSALKDASEDIATVMVGTGVLLTSPVSFPLFALHLRRDARAQVKAYESRRALQDADV